MREQALDLQDILRIIHRNFWVIALTIALCTALAGISAYYLPKRFKAKGVISLQATYFQNPLVRDLISDIYDQSELNSQREALFKYALNNNFLDKLGDKYNLFEQDADEAGRDYEREKLRERIEIFSTSPGTFQVSVTSPGRISAFQMSREVLSQIVNTIIDQRTTLLTNLRSAMEGHLQSISGIIGAAGPESDGAATSDSSAAGVRAKLAKLRADIRLLLVNFTDKHPDVIKLRAKQNSLEARLEEISAAETPDSPTDVKATAPLAALYTSASDRSVRELYADLLKKLSNIDIVLNLEKDRRNLPYISIVEQPLIPSSAIFPRVDLFLAFGLLLGILCATLIVIYLEMLRGTFMSPQFVSEQLQLPLLGELPSLEGNLSLPGGGYLLGRGLPELSREIAKR
ncbi:MAG: hypothetical protein GX589_00220 [Deltaproteobacteria bacterium]|nr:hypothetical protein [Deltaproteobacteria bacterium]